MPHPTFNDGQFGNYKYPLFRINHLKFAIVLEQNAIVPEILGATTPPGAPNVFANLLGSPMVS